MDKSKERVLVETVYGRSTLEIQETEEPDFLCSLQGNTPFGVEVTEFFMTESDARLCKIHGYASELIKGGNLRHKDDKKIRVEDVVYILGDDPGDERTIRAIVHDIPPHYESMQYVLYVIEAKN